MSDARAAAVAGTLLLCLATPSAQAPVASDAPAVLAQRVGLTRAELAALNRGDTIARVLEKRDRRDIAVLGAVRINVPPDFFLSRVADITTFKQGKLVQQIGAFGEPPQRDDLNRLTFDKTDLDSLEHCRIGACEVRLPAADLTHLRTALDWKSRDRYEAAGAWLRDRIFGYVSAYRSGGNAALITYADEKRPTSLAAEMATLLEYASPFLAQTPEFAEYLARYPESALRPGHDFLYWSKEAFGLKPVVSVTHVSIYTPNADARRQVSVIASKQVYASHYFDGSLSLSLVVPSSAAADCSTYLVYVNRSRTDVPGGLLGGLARSIAQRRAAEGMKDTLLDTRRRLEAAFR